MKIIKKTTDPIAIRISAGGLPTIGNYMVYRGSKEQVKAILEDCLRSINEMREEPETDYSEFGGF